MQEIVSPCTSVCKLDDLSGFCLGCWRTREEIAGWKRLLNDEKRLVLKALHERREASGMVKTRRKNRRRSGEGNLSGSSE
jgi:predicted Fe-S protein YdhL (DUF1289 family)